MSKSPLIWFQHFHKAGGSSFVTAARESGRKLFMPNRNGNPVADDGNYLPLWAWKESELRAWLQLQAGSGVNFIACEWGFPPDLLAIRSSDLYLFTIVRHPVERLLSNFYYDVLNGYTHVRDIDAYMELDPDYTKPDYYTRLLTGYSGKEATREAAAILRQFDTVAVLEAPASFKPMEAMVPGIRNFHANLTPRHHQELIDLVSTTERKRPALEIAAKREIALYEAISNGDKAAHWLSLVRESAKAMLRRARGR